MPRVAIALGSNLGDRHAHLTWAIAQLRSHLHHLVASSFIDTVPLGVPDPQPNYLNGAVIGQGVLIGAGATTGGTLDLATLIKPVLTQGTIRVIGSSTFEDFKHLEKDRKDKAMAQYEYEKHHREEH